jgi:AcrR family transcriptional regulator
MKSEDRRELIITAATAVFGQNGYVGTTTDQVAKAAGVSQPYVVRMFGTKQALYLEVIERALDALMATFRAQLGVKSAKPLHERLGYAYAVMSVDQTGLLLCLMHAFVLGGDPDIGPTARRGFLEVYDFLRDEAGFTSDEATQFLSFGMLMNTLMGIHMEDEYVTSPRARELMECAFPTKLGVILKS